MMLQYRMIGSPEIEFTLGAASRGGQLPVYHPSDVELGETIKRIRGEIERRNPERGALDSVSELKVLSQTSVRYRREILGLKQFFAGRRCTVLVLDDLTAHEGEQQLQSIAHGVVRMECEEC
jgi:circadian clock protein KaiC